MAVKRSDRIVLGSCAAGAAAGLALWGFIPGLSGWAALIFGVLITAGIYKAWLDQAAKTTIVDHLPPKR